MKILKRLFRLTIISVFGLTLFVIGASGDQTFFRHWYPNSVISIDPDIANELIQNSDVLVLDVRESNEFEVSHLENAVLFDEDELDHVSKDTPIILYCTVGYRSAIAAKQLQDRGFENIYNLNGGLIFWKNLNRDVYNSDEQKTDSVHVYNQIYSLWLDNGVAAL